MKQKPQSNVQAVLIVKLVSISKISGPNNKISIHLAKGKKSVNLVPLV